MKQWFDEYHITQVLIQHTVGPWFNIKYSNISHNFEPIRLCIALKFSKRLKKSKHQWFSAFEVLYNLTIRCLMLYQIGPMVITLAADVMSKYYYHYQIRHVFNIILTPMILDSYFWRNSKWSAVSCLLKCRVRSRCELPIHKFQAAQNILKVPNIQLKLTGNVLASTLWNIVFGRVILPY